MLRPGDRVGDRYEIIEQLGEGGMGTLFRAHHLELDVDVALKVVAARMASAGSLKRFKREARAAAKLRSPNIVQVLDYGEYQGHPYLAMELLRGEDLAARIGRVGRLPFEECARIMQGVAKAVQVAHRAGIVHRDLKPANIFLERVGEDEVVKILDFGVAKDLNAPIDPGSTTAAGVVGSPAYMSPEQVWAQEVGPRSDVWAMGVIAFELITGKNPFLDETLAKIFEHIIRDPLPKPSAFRPGLPAALDGFCERALARSPKDRLTSAKELADAFCAAIEGKEPPPRSPHDSDTLADKDLGIAREAVTERRRLGGASGFSARSIALLLLGGLVLAGAIALTLFRRDLPPPPLAVTSPPSARPVAPTELPRPPEREPAAASPATVTAAVSAPAAQPPRRKEVSAAPRKEAEAPAARSGNVTGAPRTRAPGLDPRFGIPVGP
jgi:eukaryotic-like serine/threonine-protein kinase